MERCQKWFHFAAVVRGLKEERNDRLRECEMEMTSRRQSCPGTGCSRRKS